MSFIVTNTSRVTSFWQDNHAIDTLQRRLHFLVSACSLDFLPNCKFPGTVNHVSKMKLRMGDAMHWIRLTHLFIISCPVVVPGISIYVQFSINGRSATRWIGTLRNMEFILNMFYQLSYRIAVCRKDVNRNLCEMDGSYSADTKIVIVAVSLIINFCCTSSRYARGRYLYQIKRQFSVFMLHCDFDGHLLERITVVSITKTRSKILRILIVLACHIGCTTVQLPLRHATSVIWAIPAKESFR